MHVWKLQAREPGDPAGFRRAVRGAHRQAERSSNVSGGTGDMNANRKSDESIVPATSANKDVAAASAESIEERDSAERNGVQSALSRTLGRTHGKSRGLHGVREAAFALDSRQEPYEVILHVRICAGGRRQRRSLPRSAGSGGR